MLKPIFLFLIISFFFPISSVAQFSIPTINVDRVFYDWRDSGINCDDNKDSYWYVLHEEMNDEIRKEVRLCGGSVLYVGKRNELHLYYQAISVSCDSVSSLLMLDSDFLNVLPLIAEEKVSYNIYRDSGLYYVDSANLIFASDVALNIVLNDSIYNFILTCVDSIDTTSNNLLVYGIRDEMLKIASDKRIKKVFDRPKEVPLNCFKSSFHFAKKSYNLLKKDYKNYNLNGRIISENNHATGIQFINGQLIINNLLHKSIKTGAEKN